MNNCIAHLMLSAFSGFAITKIDSANDVVTMIYYWMGHTSKRTQNKIYYGVKGMYIKKYGRRYYLNDFIKGGIY